MPYAYNVYTGNGSATQYTIGFPYIRKEHVKVFVNYVDTTFTFANDTTAQLSSAPANGVQVEVRRITPADNVLVDYTDGSTLTAADLDTNALQQLYLDQELDDAQKRVVTISSTTGLPTLGNQRLTNVSDPTGAQDAATKNYVDTNFQPLDAELTELATMSSGTASALADLTQTETQILDGATVTTAELNTLDGITASTAELNKLDGVTANTAELNKLDGVTASTAELNILDGVTATAAEINKLDGVTASTSELNTLDGVTATAAEINKLDGVTATTAELNFVDGVTSAIQSQIDGKQPLDSELTELSTMQSGTASALADLTQAEVQVLDGATLSTAELNKLDGVTSTTNELNILDGVTATTTELNVTDGLTAATAELNQLDGKTISSTLTPANTNDIPTSSAVNTFVSGLLNALGGFVAIPNETSFPTTNPDPSDNAGTVVSIADAGGVVVDANGASTTGRTTGNVTVTITGFPSSLQSTTLGAGLGLQVQTTSTLNTYTYHKLIAKETDVVQLSDDINDFNARYRVSANAPTTDLDAGDLWFDTTAGKMKVYDANDSAWEEVQSVGNFFINTLSSSSGTGGGSATFNGSAYRFTLSNAGANAQQMLVSVNGVIQKPNSGTSQPSEGFAIDTNDIIFAAAPASGASHFIVTIGSTVNIGQPSNNTVDTSELVDGAVTNAKVSSSAAIAGTKISPDFGTQDVETDGNVYAQRIGVNTSTPRSVSGFGSLAVDGTSGSFVDLFRNGTREGTAAVDSGGFKLEAVGSSTPLIVITNGSERLRVDSSGNLGLGVTNPGNFKAGAENLVIGSGSGAEGMTIYSASNASGRICFADNDGASDEERGVIQYAHDDNHMQFNTDATERMRITSAGNVGVNTNSPDTKLEVSGGQNQTANQFTDLLRVAANANNDSASGTVQLNFGIQPSHTDAANRMARIQSITQGGDTRNLLINPSGGNVGIGTTLPQGALQVSRGSGNAKIFIHRTNAAANTNDYGSIIWRSNGGNNNGVVAVARQSAENDGYMFFSTASGGTLSERMRIFAGGGVGISTTNQIASAPLTIGGTNGVQVRSTGVDGTFADTFSSFYSGNNNEKNVIKTAVSSNGNGSGFLFEGSNGGGSASTTDMYKMCRTEHKVYIAGTELYRIDNNRVISIADSNPGTGHHVHIAYSPNQKGCVYLENFAYYSAQPALTINDQDTNSARNMEDVQFKRAGNLKGYIRIGPSSVTYSTSSSDRRAKKNFEDWTEDNLVKFKTLSPQLFNWIEEEDGAEKTKGFIAQDNLEKFPEAYPLTSATDRYSFNPPGMVAYMMKALQEAALKIETLETQNASLEARLTALEGAS